MTTISNESLGYFAESMDVSREFIRELRALQKPIEYTCYRGVPLPQNIIKENEVLNGLYSIEHWTTDLNIARRFSTPELDGILDDDYLEIIKKEYKLHTVLVVPTILRCRNVHGVELHKILEEYKTDDVDDRCASYSEEKEVTTFNKEVVVLKATVQDGVYLCDCIMRDRRK